MCADSGAGERKKIDVMSLAYNRLMNHVKYMVMRAVRGESIKLDMNEYMEEKHPESFALAAAICEKLNAAARSGWKNGSRLPGNAY